MKTVIEFLKETNPELLKDLGNGTVKPKVFKTMEEYANQSKKEVWEAACKQTLDDISTTFLTNLDRADKASDKDVFRAIGETIKNFPISDYPEKP